MNTIFWMSGASIVASWFYTVIFAILAISLHRRTHCPGSRELAIGFGMMMALSLLWMPVQWIPILAIGPEETLPLPTWKMIFWSTPNVVRILGQVIVLVGFWKLGAFVMRSGQTAIAEGCVKEPSSVASPS